jgi:hypothetical protein
MASAWVSGPCVSSTCQGTPAKAATSIASAARQNLAWPIGDARGRPRRETGPEAHGGDQQDQRGGGADLGPRGESESEAGGHQGAAPPASLPQAGGERQQGARQRVEARGGIGKDERAAVRRAETEGGGEGGGGKRRARPAGGGSQPVQQEQDRGGERQAGDLERQPGSAGSERRGRRRPAR